MSKLEPGELFAITYGNGHALEVVVLSISQKMKVAKTLQAFKNKEISDPVQVYEEMVNAVRACVPQKSDEEFGALMDKCDETMCMDIVNQAISGQRLTDEERKKFVLPQSSEAGGSAVVAEVAAEKP